MTLHISFVSRRFVLHVSDRLVSRPTRTGVVPFDPQANKTVIFFARDAYVTIGYTGLAYLDGKPTDQWIAEKLARDDFDGWGPFLGGGIGQQVITGPPPPWFDLGIARQTLRQELINATSRLPISQRSQFPTLVMSGWQRGKKLWRPILFYICDTGSGDLYQGYGWSQRYGWEQGIFYLDFTPRSDLLNSVRNKLDKTLQQARSEQETELYMADALRFASENSLGIGKDYLSVLLPPPGARLIRTRYVAHDDRTEVVPGLFTPYVGPVGYSPWIVAPNFISGPAILVGSPGVVGPLGDFSVQMEGPPNVSGVGPIVSIISQQRPPWRPARVHRAVASGPPIYFTSLFDDYLSLQSM